MRGSRVFISHIHGVEMPLCSLERFEFMNTGANKCRITCMSNSARDSEMGSIMIGKRHPIDCQRDLLERDSEIFCHLLLNERKGAFNLDKCISKSEYIISQFRELHIRTTFVG